MHQLGHRIFVFSTCASDKFHLPFARFGVFFYRVDNHADKYTGKTKPAVENRYYRGLSMRCFATFYSLVCVSDSNFDCGNDTNYTRANHVYTCQNGRFA